MYIQPYIVYNDYEFWRSNFREKYEYYEIEPVTQSNYNFHFKTGILKQITFYDSLNDRRIVFSTINGN